jgi:hypothetical protein
MKRKFFVLGFFAGMACTILILFPFRYFLDEARNAVLIAEANKLYRMYEYWNRNGRVNGEKLVELIKERPEFNIMHLNLPFETTNYSIIFSKNDPAPYFSGNLYIDTNGVIIWQPKMNIINIQ